MLYSIDSQKYINYIPHEENYRTWRGRLTQEQYDAIIAELNNRIDSDEIHAAGWIPGHNWTGTVYEPIYQIACQHNEDLSGKCFGLFLWVVIMEREEDVWGFGRFEKDGIPIEGMTYFRLDNPPPRP